MGFIFHYTCHFLCSFLKTIPFVLSHQQMRQHSVIDEQLNVLIFAFIFNFYFLFYDVYGFLT